MSTPNVSGEFPVLEGVASTSPSTLRMDGTSPVTVNVQATTDELRAIHRKRVRLVVVEDDFGSDAQVQS